MKHSRRKSSCSNLSAPPGTDRCVRFVNSPETAGKDGWRTSGIGSGGRQRQGTANCLLPGLGWGNNNQLWKYSPGMLGGERCVASGAAESQTSLIGYKTDSCVIMRTKIPTRAFTAREWGKCPSWFWCPRTLQLQGSWQGYACGQKNQLSCCLLDPQWPLVAARMATSLVDSRDWAISGWRAKRLKCWQAPPSLPLHPRSPGVLEVGTETPNRHPVSSPARTGWCRH